VQKYGILPKKTNAKEYVKAISE